MRAQIEQWWEQRIDREDGAKSYHIAYEHSELVSTNVVLSIAAIEGVEPTGLPPLGAAVDPDALDDLIGEGEMCGSISFRYAGYEVTIHSDGRLEVVSVRDLPSRGCGS
ncbi:hypothetical protein NDI76_17000 [Halogeometricum sp. S1BR25-6]|uniref:Halobacterial output domain-containing protein n=1 Tax=Halogeometricum salsisoli TaxID=2950536 RepID=A0ABU2GJH7_9EURY|nr:HalOD1 output domain-containing protein [Halogeometricum sp. S1BR25-6]MDS0300448.1 hypothetical protein [Halogeometricum sp. S1BR25-6]